jgi:hypothetical protein
MISIGDFYRRQNPDSTIDLICSRCFQTAGSGETDAEALAAAEYHRSCCRPLNDSQSYFADYQNDETSNRQHLPR